MAPADDGVTEDPPTDVDVATVAGLADLSELTRRLLALSPAGLAVRDEAGEWALVNAAFADVFGADSPEELIGEPWTQLYAKTARSTLADEGFPALGERGSWSGELEGQRLDGSPVHHEVALSELPDGRTAWAVREVPDRDPAGEDAVDDPLVLPEEDVIEPDTAQPLTADGSGSQARWFVDADTRDLRFSDGLYGLLGIEPSREASVETYLDAVHPEDEARVRERFTGAVDEGQGFDVHHRIVREAADGEREVRHVQLTALALDETDGAPGVVGTVDDVTEMREQVARQVGAEDRFRLLLDQLPMAVYEFDRDDEAGPRPRFVGSVVEDVLGYAAATLEDDPSIFLDRIHPDDHAKRSRTLEQLASDRGPVEVRYRFEHGDTRDWVWISESIVPRVDEDGQRSGFVSLLRDVTETQSRLHELERYGDELVEANEQLDRFAYIAAHELKEPLRNIASFAQLLDRRYGDAVDDEGQEFLDYFLDATKRMRQQVDDILAYTRVDTEGLNRERVPMGELLNLALENLDDLIDETGAQVSAFEMPEVYGDKYQLVQVLQNLIQNGIRFNENEAPFVHLDVETHEDEWLVRVTDNGTGIPEDHHERVFEIFEKLQTDEEEPGTGLGLAICKRIVERHGGEIWIEGQPDEGTTVKFTLPRPRV